MKLPVNVLPAAIATILSLSAGLIAQTTAAPAPAPTYPATVSQMVARTKAELKPINLADFKALYDRKETGLLIDVRNENEFEEGFIAGAVNVPRGLVEFRIWKLAGFPAKTDLDTKMTVYCATGGRAVLAAKTLRELGFTNVTAVDCKFEDWMKAGYPVGQS